MVLRRDGDAVLAIGQASHAWISGQLARAWSGIGTRRDEVCLAAEQHDVGMSEWDLAPTLNPDTGLPHSFMEMPLATHLGLWERAARRLMSQSAYAALLVSMHGTALYERRDPSAPGVREFLDGQRALQDMLVEVTRADRDELRRHQRLVWAWDFLSLALCLDWAPTSLEDVPTSAGEATLELEPEGALDPWPFTIDPLDVRCEARRLDRTFGDGDEMRAALAQAPVETVRFRLTRAGGRAVYDS
jgi:hypothetical protein